MPVLCAHAQFVPEAVDSMFAQTSPQWHLVAVAERDEAEAIRELLQPWTGDERVRVVVNTGRKLAGAVNTGVGAAETPFVALLLDDDLWETTAVETLDWYIEAMPSVDFFHSGRRIIDATGSSISTEHLPREHVSVADFEAMAPVKHLLCWRRDKGLAVGGLHERGQSVGPDDFDFPWTMAEQGAVFCAIRECLYVYR